MPMSSGMLMTEIQLAAVNPTMMTTAMKKAMPKLLELAAKIDGNPIPPDIAYKLSFVQGGVMAAFEKFLTDHQEALRTVVRDTSNVEIGQALFALEEANGMGDRVEARHSLAEAYANYTADLCVGFATFIFQNKEVLSIFELLNRL